MAKHYIQDSDGKKLAGVYESRAEAEHKLERLAVEHAAGFSVISDTSEDQAKYAAEVEKERRTKQDRERQRKEQEEFAKARQ